MLFYLYLLWEAPVGNALIGALISCKTGSCVSTLSLSSCHIALIVPGTNGEFIIVFVIAYVMFVRENVYDEVCQPCRDLDTSYMERSCGVYGRRICSRDLHYQPLNVYIKQYLLFSRDIYLAYGSCQFDLKRAFSLSTTQNANVTRHALKMQN